MLHKQRNFPRRRRIDDIDFLAAGIVWQFVVGRHVKDLAPSVDRIHEDDFVAQDVRVASGYSLQKGKIKNQDPSLLSIAFFFSTTGGRLLTVKYVLNFKCNSC